MLPGLRVWMTSWLLATVTEPRLDPVIGRDSGDSVTGQRLASAMARGFLEFLAGRGSTLPTDNQLLFNRRLHPTPSGIRLVRAIILSSDGEGDAAVRRLPHTWAVKVPTVSFYEVAPVARRCHKIVLSTFPVKRRFKVPRASAFPEILYYSLFRRSRHAIQG
ncbi:hypothetical protein VTK56DRAFT_609 [Thermocarpiscus australiensis]